MKKFTLRILGPSTTWIEIVEAETFETLNGHYSFVIGNGFNNDVNKIVLQPDGKILVGGY